MRIDSAIITGSFSVNGDTFNDLGAYTTTGSNTFVGNQSIVGAVSASAFTGSISYTNLTDVPTLVSGSEQIVGILSSLNSYTQSNDTTNTTQNSRLNSLENKTGSLATTGSNTFYGTQVFSGSLFVQDNLVVQGSSSLQNITASAVSIGTNTVLLNTANPSIRFGGISVVDSGSAAGKSGSLYFDSTDDEWVFVHAGNTTVTSSIMITGPETYDSIGNETRLTTNTIPKVQSGFHLYDSCITDNGSSVTLKSNVEITGSLSVMGDGAVLNRTSSGEPYLFFRKDGVNRGSIYGVSGGGLRIFDQSDNQILTITSSFVGVGVSTPCQKLHVFGVGDSTKARIELYGQAGVNEVLQLANTANFNPGRGVKIGLYVNCCTNQSQLGAEIGAVTVSGDNHGASLFFNTTYAGTSSEKMRISNTGNVGIGCSDPQAPLHIKSTNGCSIRLSYGSNSGYGAVDVDSANSLIFKAYLGTEYMRITCGGCVGIGTSTPRATLHVKQATNDGTPSLGTARDGTVFSSNNNNYGLNLTIDPSGDTIMQAMRFDGVATAYNILLNPSGGKIGIGKSPSSAFLDITGGSDGDAMISIGSNSVSGILNTPSNLYINADSDNNSASGQIQFGFNRTGYTGGLVGLTITEGGQIGVGQMAPSAWVSPFNVIQGGYYGQHVGFQTNGADMKLGSNNYYSGAGYCYTCTNYGAVQINVGASSAGGYFSVNSAPSGTAGQTVTFTERFNVSADGSVNIDSSGVGTRSYIRMGRFSNSITNAGEAWLGRASDRLVGQMTVQIGSGDNRTFEVVDYQWSKVVFYVNGSGNYDFYGSDLSDRRQKDNITYITNNQICNIMKLKSASFNKKNGVDGGLNTNVHTGFIAQDVLESNIPNLVHGTEEDGYGLDYNGILSLAVKAIQEQQCTIDTLKSCLGIN